MSGNDGKIRVRLGTKLYFQNNILLANGFVAKANQIFGFIPCKAVLDIIYVIFEKKVIWCKSLAKILTIYQCTEAVARKNFQTPLSFDTYRSYFYNFCMYCCVDWIVFFEILIHVN